LRDIRTYIPVFQVIKSTVSDPLGGKGRRNAGNENKQKNNAYHRHER
jgi:hypothetical protein